MTDKYSVEAFVRIFDDESGTYFQAGPDRDGLDLCEISANEGDQSKPTHYVVMPWAAAVLLAEAVLRLAPQYIKED